MIRVWWFVGVNLVETLRANWPIRIKERADSRVLDGEALVTEIERSWR